MRDISQRQRDVLNAIRKSIATQGYPPTVRELATSLGVASLNSVAPHLAALEKKGYIRRTPEMARGILLLITPSSRAPACPMCGGSGHLLPEAV